LGLDQVNKGAIPIKKSFVQLGNLSLGVPCGMAHCLVEIKKDSRHTIRPSVEVTDPEA
jgi:hypothetical protein